MATAGAKRSGRVFTAQCDTSFRLAQNIRINQKRKLAKWSVREWSKMINLKNTQMFLEKQGNYVTLRMIGQRSLVEAGRRLSAAFQARVYLGQRSMMLVAVGESVELSPSDEMDDFLNNRVSR
jgi:hypothetical protein